MSVEMKRRLFTVPEYHLMIKVGVFNKNNRVELIEGEIIEMAAIGTRHASCVKRLIAMFSDLERRRAILGVQDPIQLTERTEPQPDVVLLQPRSDYYATAHPIPSEVLLLVEVSDSTVDFDRDVKVPNYARSGIQEVWLWDLEENCLEVYRQPTINGYTSIQKFERGQQISPLAFPDFVVSIDLILG
ncbi:MULTISPECIES: Uma2 family endonuclease [unclassified Microcoleus]|jgi:Uma2 family endonuclease|uniref:Uma2 family endonuclease n=1 Tax=unclassified Microcoleus TaxID=2642155 RepID=UPI001DEA1D57|nr:MULTISPECIES: Uma2 family endonuclease [unclassified Microcoleus]MCC3419635.1 Uma2 family endonuclease [Microcoleus sp. PH2017_07_MST_O_A]MCC3510166.1 Uma2 family endonuclease [Microcoleus sp. PH2017_17_BER_D_A]TAE07792.1 MAG: Uma2 family endonuclease [Oscillatoriales cyanobacterium]MCC3414557.1 Uma2 family endonuclease [Microcoleus sp. PH2017_02_FOX_O_A]MCC3422917.1 Uma2 family endonuclease [Microcoleus sp. PH2017_01_SCD_O_A]